MTQCPGYCASRCADIAKFETFIHYYNWSNVAYLRDVDEGALGTCRHHAHHIVGVW